MSRIQSRCFALLLLLCAVAKAQLEAPEEIIVTGRSPGPALWKVSNGDNTLWIFALMSPTPKGMVWESKRVEQVIADADEFIEPPGVSLGVLASVKYNPLNWIRGISFYKRLRQNPGGKKLQEVLPPPLYQRYAA